jgi:hypothetical protein
MPVKLESTVIRIESPVFVTCLLLRRCQKLVLSLEKFTYNCIIVDILAESTVHYSLENVLKCLYFGNLSAVSGDTLQAYSSSAHLKLKWSQNVSF